MIETYGLLIFPKEWTKFATSAHRQLIRSPYKSFVRFAEIRKTSQKVGEIRYRDIRHIKSMMLCDKYLTQKRWYKCLVTYNDDGKNINLPEFEMLYLNIEPWIMRELETRELEKVASASKE